MKSIELKDKKDLINVKDTNKVLLSLITLSGALISSFLIILILVLSNYRLSRQEKIFVEQADGSTQIAAEKDYNFRSEETIRKTISDWLYLTWEWDSTIPNSEQLDIGVKIKHKQEEFRVPSKTYAASYLIEQGFRQEFLQGLSELIPKTVYNGSLTSQLTIYHIGKPIRKDDSYEVKVIATRKDLSGSSGEVKEAKFNKIITLKTIEPYSLVLNEEEPNIFKKSLKQILEGGLIITDITNFS